MNDENMDVFDPEMDVFDPDPEGQYYVNAEEEAEQEEYALDLALEMFGEWVEWRYEDLVRELKKKHGDNAGDFLQDTLTRLVEKKSGVQSNTYWWIF
jgi:hypothetical protein